jgi:hypothetical protein
MYDASLRSLIDQHAPERVVQITVRPDVPWFNYEIRACRRELRRLERQWKQTRLSVHLQMLHAQRNQLTRVRRQAKITYFSDKISSATSPKELASITSGLLQKKKDSLLPSTNNDVQLAETFANFFDNKITNIRSRISPPAVSSTTSAVATSDIASMTAFLPATEEEIAKVVKSSPCKTSCLDPLPSWLLRQCLPALLPVLTSVANLSLSTACVPKCLKEATITPLLKKPSLDPEEMKNYRPVSNLTYLSKLIERVVAKRIQDHCASNNIINRFQSAYKSYHSTETALIRVQNDLLQAVDNEGGAILVLLDLSAAFDTIDHQLLLQHLQRHVGITGSALLWLTNYLQDRSQRIRVRSSLSDVHVLEYGVPQGSVLGPLLFTLYTHPLSSVVSRHQLHHHLYADDTQLYLSFSPRSPSSFSASATIIEAAVNDIKLWMDAHFLKLNQDKTEILVIRRPSLRCPPSAAPSLQICGCDVTPCPAVRDLGVMFDECLSLETQVRAVCKSAYFHIHSIWTVRKYLTESATRSLVQAHVMSRLDYCNALYYGIPAYLRNHLQRVQNAAARVVACVGRRDHISPVLQRLHWLPIEYRVKYKIQLLTFKILHHLAPSYLDDLVHLYIPTRVLRSSSETLLARPQCKLQSVGGRAFAVCAPILWNELPNSLRSCSSVDSFKQQLKTFHFNAAFNV